MTAIRDRTAPDSYEYVLDTPAGTTLRENGIGYQIIGPDGHSLGFIHEAWATDSNGKAVPTEYTFSNNVLTQHIDLSNKDIAFPVLADPAWSYSFTKPVVKRSPAQIYNLLHDCFNCFFPVEGAPAAWPSFKQYLPLKVRPFFGSPIWWDFSCYFQTYYFETLGSMSYFGYYFLASSTHVDGEGSSISFDFNPINGGSSTELAVNAYIINDDPVGVGQPAYTIAAKVTWSQFADNLDF